LRGPSDARLLPVHRENITQPNPLCLRGIHHETRLPNAPHAVARIAARLSMVGSVGTGKRKIFAWTNGACAWWSHVRRPGSPGVATDTRDRCIAMKGPTQHAESTDTLPDRNKLMNHKAFSALFKARSQLAGLCVTLRVRPRIRGRPLEDTS
jgi:hypothetical protein